MAAEDHVDQGRYEGDKVPTLSSGVVAFETATAGQVVLVEQNSPARDRGVEHTQISLGGRNVVVDQARVGLEAALQGVRPAAKALLDQFKSLGDDVAEVELELGLKLTAEAGAIIARTSAEGHCTVKIKFVRARGSGSAGGAS
jgi:hypothetical protein